MVQYILENIFSFGIGTAFLISTFILGFFFLFRARKQSGLEKRATLTLGIALFLFGAAHLIWTLRAAFIPGHALGYVFFSYWQGFWILLMLGIAFIGLWSLQLTYPAWLKTRKWILFIVFIPWILVTLDVLLFTDPSIAPIVCSARIWDLAPGLVTTFTVGISLTIFVGLVIDYYFNQFQIQKDKLPTFLTLLGFVLVLLGGLLETKAIPICEIITLGRVLMLAGLWLASIGILTIKPLLAPQADAS